MAGSELSGVRGCHKMSSQPGSEKSLRLEPIQVDCRLHSLPGVVRCTRDDADLCTKCFPRHIDCISAVFSSPAPPPLAVTEAVCWLMRAFTLEASDAELAPLRGDIIAIAVTAVKTHRESTAILEYSCRALGSLARDSETKKMVISAGAMSALVPALSAHVSSLTVSKHVCWTLESLAIHVENIAPMIHNGAISPVLCAMITHADSAVVVEHAARLFGHVALNPAGRAALLREGTITALISALRDHVSCAPVIIPACRTLRLLALSSEHQVGIGRAGAIPALTAALAAQAHRADAVEAICSTIRSLAFAVDNQNVMMEGGVVPLVVVALHAHLQTAADATEAACRALRNLTQSASQQLAVGAAGAIPALMAVLEVHVSSDRCVAAACGVLANLAAHSANRCVMLQKDIAVLLAAALSKHAAASSAIVERISLCVRNLALDGPAARGLLLKAGMVSALIAALQTHAPAGPVSTVTHLCWSLHNLSLDSDGRVALVSADACPLLLGVIVNPSTSTTVIETACGILRNTGIHTGDVRIPDIDGTVAVLTAHATHENVAVVLCLLLRLQATRHPPWNDGYLDLLLYLLSEYRNSASIAEAACDALCAFLAHEECDSSTINPDVIAALIFVVMNAHISLQSVVESCCAILRCIVSAPGGPRVVEAAAGVPVFLAALQRHVRSEYIPEIVCAILRKIDNDSLASAFAASGALDELAAELTHTNLPDLARKSIFDVIGLCASASCSATSVVACAYAISRDLALSVVAVSGALRGVVEPACRALLALTLHPAFSSAASRYDIVPSLLATLYQPGISEHLIDTACRVLQALVSSSDGKFQAAIVDGGGLAALMRLLRCVSPTSEAAASLRSLLRSLADNVACITVIAKAGGFNLLLETISDPAAQAETVEATSAILYALIQADATAFLCAIDVNSVRMLLYVMTRFAGSLEITSSVCGILEVAVGSYASSVSDIFTCGGVPALLGALKLHFSCDSIVRAACYILHLLALRAECQGAIVKAAGVPILLRTISNRALSVHSSVGRSICGTLRSIAQNPALRAAVLEAGTAPVLQELISTPDAVDAALSSELFQTVLALAPDE
jgi:hypothetical protein